MTSEHAGREPGPVLDDVAVAVSPLASGPAGSDALEHAVRSAAETLILLITALRGEGTEGDDEAVHDALAGARATTEAVKFALASRGRGAVAVRHRPTTLDAPDDRALA